MAEFKPKIALSGSLPAVENGALVVTTDTGEEYVDIGNERIKLSDVVQLTKAQILALQNPDPKKLYKATDTKDLLTCQVNGNVISWSELSSANIVENSSAAVTLTLASNTFYYLTNANITSITISGVTNGVEGYHYSTITFDAPATAPTFAMPATGYYCTGSDCSSGVFTPQASKRYWMCIDSDMGGRITICVRDMT